MAAAEPARMNSGDWKTLKWNNPDPFLVHRAFFRGDGYIVKDGVRYGEGRIFHLREMMKALWPTLQWHRWSELMIELFGTYSEIGIMGPGSSGKTYLSGAYALAVYYAFSEGTSIVMSTTTRSALQLRIWGAVKELHNKAKKIRPFLPGKVRESMFMLTTEGDDDEATDFRDGIVGVACRVGGQFVGISNYVGLKNERVILIADEASLMPKGFLDSVSNLRKNPFFQLIAMGNPKDRTDALGMVCEPHASIGGWEGHEIKEETRIWKTKAKNGIAVQLCGWDTPNGDFPKGQNPYKGLITPEMIEADLEYYGRDSLQFSMMNLGVMPKDGGSRRVVSGQFCSQNKATEDVIWMSDNTRTRVVGLDAAYSGVGGDRCVLTDLWFGPDRDGNLVIGYAEPPVIVPVSPASSVSPEDQIATYCKEYCTLRNVPPESFGLDSTGRGSLVSALARLWSSAVIPVEFGGKALDRLIRNGDPKQQKECDAYGKMVTALWFYARLVIEAKQMRNMPSEVIEEGSIREWGINRDGRIDVEPKDKTKLRMGRSPDLFDSLVVGLEVSRRRGFDLSSAKWVGVVKRSASQVVARAGQRHQALLKSGQLNYQ